VGSVGYGQPVAAKGWWPSGGAPWPWANVASLFESPLIEPGPGHPLCSPLARPGTIARLIPPTSAALPAEIARRRPQGLQEIMRRLLIRFVRLEPEKGFRLATYAVWWKPVLDDPCTALCIIGRRPRVPNGKLSEVSQ
jgi:hypothetical protein